MITVHIYYTGAQGSALRFAQEMTESGAVEKIRAEAGNLGYAYYPSLEDPETVLLVDSWQDQAAIDAHHQSPMMSRTLRLSGNNGLCWNGADYV